MSVRQTDGGGEVSRELVEYLNQSLQVFYQSLLMLSTGTGGEVYCFPVG